MSHGNLIQKLLCPVHAYCLVHKMRGALLVTCETTLIDTMSSQSAPSDRRTVSDVSRLFVTNVDYC